MTSLYPSSSLSSSSSYTPPSKSRNKIRSLPTTLKSPPASYPDLPSDPKRWSSSHVATYLTYCLRLYPSAIVSDLSRHVKEDSTLTGRKFLRLKEDQLRQMNFNEKWIKLIMIGVKILRREHLKDKILLNGGDIISEPDEMKITQESSEESGEERYSSFTRNSFERNSNNTSSNNDLKNFLIPTSFSNLTSDDKEFISQEFSKLKEFLKSDIEKENNHTKFNEINLFIEKVLSNIEMNREIIHHVKSDDEIKIIEDSSSKETSKPTSSLFSLILFDWLNNKWKKNMVFEKGFAQGVMIGGIAVWTYMRYYKWLIP